ncbi:hypothetical protein TNCV_3796351 [Trichonephila clavipes]|nr:hypothetical protein TNCV_3796351 [Trichonephila clavipes]
MSAKSECLKISFLSAEVGCEGIISCEIEKKELEESQDASGKGPDIIPLSKDPEVFHLEGYLDDVHRSECLQKQDSPPTEVICYKTDKLEGRVGGTEAYQYHIGMQGRNCRSSGLSSVLKQQHINETENILFKECTIIGIRNYDQKSSGRLGITRSFKSVLTKSTFRAIYR